MTVAHRPLGSMSQASTPSHRQSASTSRSCACSAGSTMGTATCLLGTHHIMEMSLTTYSGQSRITLFDTVERTSTRFMRLRFIQSALPMKYSGRPALWKQ